MLTVYTDAHRAHAGRHEFHRGALHPCFERPERAELVLQGVRRRGFEVVGPDEGADLAPLHRVHRPRYLAFLQTVYDEWQALHPGEDAVAHVWCGRGLRPVEPESVYGRLGYYSFDASTPITAGTWAAALAAVRVALTAQRLVRGGARAAFALTRPPGHHAGADFCGGYGFLNSAAVAAEAFRRDGAARVAVLDVDFHHGNGTQSVFYDRSDVLFASVHADPAAAYPYFLGYRDEGGEGAGAGFNLNYPLPLGTGWGRYRAALRDAAAAVRAYAPAALVVSLGVDTYRGDPISGFGLELGDFTEVGRLLGGLGLPTVFVLEGGYYPEVGEAVGNVLGGFDEAAG